MSRRIRVRTEGAFIVQGIRCQMCTSPVEKLPGSLHWWCTGCDNWAMSPGGPVGVYDVPIGGFRELPPPTFLVNGVEMPSRWLHVRSERGSEVFCAEVPHAS